jgi:FkbM family methyltransferase
VAHTDGAAELRAQASIGTVGDSYDNAMAEAVNVLYKAELQRNPAAFAANGGHWKGPTTSRSPPAAGSTGPTPIASTASSPTTPQQSSKPPTTVASIRPTRPEKANPTSPRSNPGRIKESREQHLVDMHDIKQRLPARALGPAIAIWRRSFGRRYPRKSWSQGGEDLVLLELLGDHPPGTYIDVGAFHPRWGSNTYALYKKGWSGINLDARPGSMAPFRRSRRRDINLEVGVASEAGSLDFHIFADDELCTFDEGLAKARQTNHQLLRVTNVPVLTLATLIQQHIPTGPDVLSVDVEGLDLDVLRSNDWVSYRPDLVIVEALAGPSRLREGDIVQFMAEVGYDIIAATGMNLFFRGASRLSGCDRGE